MRLYAPVPGTTGAKVLIIVYLALAGRQVRGEEQSTGASSGSKEKAKEIIDNYIQLRKGEPWEYLKVDDEISPFLKQPSDALSSYMAMKREDKDSLNSYLKKLQEDTGIPISSAELTQQPAGKPGNENLVGGKSKSELLKALPDSIRQAITKTNEAETEWVQTLFKDDPPSKDLERKFFAVRMEERDVMRKALAESGDKTEEIFDIYNQLRDGEPWEELKSKFPAFFNDHRELGEYTSMKFSEKMPLSITKIDPYTKERTKTKKRFGSKGRSSNLQENRELESEFNDMQKRRISLEENLEKRSNLLNGQEKDAEERGREVFDLEENMEDKELMEKFVEDRQDMEIVDRMERNIDKSSPEINHRKVNSDKGDSSSSSNSRSSGGRDRGVFWFSIVVGIIAEAVVIAIVLLAYRNDIYQRLRMRRSTREAEPLNPYRRYSSKISSAKTVSHSMLH